MPNSALGYSALLLNGLLAGTFIGSSLVEHSARVLTGPQWLAYKQAKEVVFAAVMPGFLLTTIVVSGVAAFVIVPARTFFAIDAVLLLGVLVVTVLVHLPINKFIQSASPDHVPAQWSDQRRRWREWNWLRCALTVGGYVVALLSPT